MWLSGLASAGRSGLIFTLGDAQEGNTGTAMRTMLGEKYALSNEVEGGEKGGGGGGCVHPGRGLQHSNETIGLVLTRNFHVTFFCL